MLVGVNLHKFFFLKKNYNGNKLTSSSSEWEEELETAAVFAVLDEENKKST